MLKRIIFLTMVMLSYKMVYAKDLAPPDHQLMDKFGVNVATGQVTTSVPTVQIGGEMGLNHTAATHDSGFVTDYNKFNLSGIPTTGFYETYDGNAIYTYVTNDSTRSVVVDGVTLSMKFLYAMQVFDKDGSENFIFKLNGVMQQSYSCNGASCPTPAAISFTPMKDKRNSLVWDGINLIWTKASGAKSYYPVDVGLSPLTGARYKLAKLEYPNGFTIKIKRAGSAVGSVTTNTGFQLKYTYQSNTNGLDANKQNTTTNVAMNASNGVNIPPIESNAWAAKNAYQIIALNNAVDSCIEVSAGDPFANTCPALSLTTGSVKKWPRATFTWPNGMPRALYIGSSTISVTDAQNRITEFGLTAYKAANINFPTSDWVDNSDAIQAPRITSVKPATSNTITTRYIYSTDNGDYLTRGGGAVSATSLVGAANLSLNKFSAVYCRVPQCMVVDSTSTSDNIERVFIRADGGMFGNMLLSATLQGTMSYNYDTAQNTPYKYQPVTGPSQDFEYDSRGNLNKIVYNKGTTAPTEVYADFPATCTNPKTCNKPTFVRDAKNNITNYIYHPDAGEVTSIRSPAMMVDGQSIEPVTRFTYQQKYANYYRDGASARTSAESPVWLKVTEKTCMKTSTLGLDALGNGSCTGGVNDEVAKTFEYNDNLLVKGVTVTALNATGALETRRTCYQYDIYGNRIGETQPKAGLGSCN